jgi:hypothetical protein
MPEGGASLHDETACEWTRHLDNWFRRNNDCSAVVRWLDPTSSDCVQSNVGGGLQGPGRGRGGGFPQRLSRYVHVAG